MNEKYGKPLPVKKVKVVVGKISTVAPEALDFAFDMVGQGTEFEGLEREIEYVPLTIRCNDCSEEMELDEPFLFCRKCDSFNVEVLTGKELYVDSFVVDDSKIDEELEEDVKHKAGVSLGIK